jgi:hypothetical protein
MLLSKASFNNQQLPPFIVKKEKEYTEEGSYSLHLFSRTVITKEGKKYRFFLYDLKEKKHDSANVAMQRIMLGTD